MIKNKQNINIIYIIIVLLTIIIYPTKAQTPTEIKAYVEKYKALALEHERLYGIPAPITLAQGILESGAGLSNLAVNANNHFGIKAMGSWDGGVYYAWDDETVKSRFRVYSSPEESFKDHAMLIKDNRRYQSLFNFSVYDYRSWANGLQKAGYATGENYAKALIGYIDAYQLYNINGGLKLKPKIKKVIKKTITVEELAVEDALNSSESTEEEEDVILWSRPVPEAINGVRCTILRPGETLSSVAMRTDIPVNKLLKYNEKENIGDFKEGDYIFLQKKKRKYHGTQDYYSVQKNETLYDIAQMFGIMVSRLAKMNDKTLTSPLFEGEKLRLK